MTKNAQTTAQLYSSHMLQTVKCLPTMQDTWVQSLGQEDLLEKEMAIHSSILAWKIPWTRNLVGYSPRGCKESDTTESLHFTSLHMLAKKCSKFSKLVFNSTWTVTFQMFKLDLEKAEEPEIKLPTSVGSLTKQESSRKISTSALLTMPKPLTVWITTKCGKFFKKWNIRPPDLPPEKSVCR